MNTLIALILVTSSAFPIPHAAADQRDQPLWDALTDLNQLRSRQKLGILLTGSGAAYIVAGGYAFFKSSARSNPRAQMLSLGIVALGMAQGVGYLAWNAHLPRHGSATKYDLRADLRAMRLEALYLNDLRAFFAQPLPTQYESAAREPRLRDYLIQLDAWMRSGVTAQAPPLRPDGPSRPN